MITRVRRILRQRLLLLLLLVLVGTVGALLATRYFNGQIRPTYQATALAYIQSHSEDTGRSGEPDQTLTSAHEAALEANADFLDIRHGIRAVPSSQSLQFIATARSEEKASTDASDMRIRYLVATAPPPLEEQIEDVLQKAHFVREELDGLLPPEVVVESDPAAVSQFSILSEQIRSLNTESAKLAVELVLADSDAEKADIQADLDLMLSQIVALQEQLEALPPEVADSASRGGASEGGEVGGRLEAQELAASDLALDDQFRIESLQSLYSSLLAEFQALYINSIHADPGTLPEIVVVDETPDPVPPALGAGIGFAGVLFLGLSGILVLDRLRPRWWAQHELAAAIAETPDRRDGESETWYWNTGSGPRKDALQKAAVRLLPAVEAGPAAVGLLGLGVAPYGMRGLGYDLGAVMVTSGRRTLVIDTTGLESSDHRDGEAVAENGLSVSDLLNPWQNGANGERARQSVAQAKELWPGLATIPAGAPTLYSVEGALTPVVGNLVDYARGSYDLTLVPIVDRGTALTDAFVRNLDAVVLVGRSGRTNLRAAEGAIKEVAAAGKPMLGTLLLVRPGRRRFREWIVSWRRKRPDSVASSHEAVAAPHGTSEPPEELETAEEFQTMQISEPVEVPPKSPGRSQNGTRNGRPGGRQEAKKPEQAGGDDVTDDVSAVRN